MRKAEPLSQEPVVEGPLSGVAGQRGGIFEHNCQACHGTGATGGMGPGLAKNPILRHEDLFWETVLHGRGPMPAWGTVLSHQDIADIHAWLGTSERAPAVTTDERSEEMMGRQGVLIGGAVIALVGLMSFPRLLFGSDQSEQKK